MLSGNTAEVNRLSGILSKIETRIELTERLDELQTAIAEAENRGAFHQRSAGTRISNSWLSSRPFHASSSPTLTKRAVQHISTLWQTIRHG
jgi:hypothetical protein